MNLQQQMRLPLRYPDDTDQRFMTKRARWLLVLGFLLPGSAQILAGKRGLGRLGFIATWLVIFGLCALLIGLLQFRVATLNFLAQPWVLTVLQVVIGLYLLVWVLLGFNTLALFRLPRALPKWRAPLAFVAVILTLLPVAAGAWAFSLLGTSRTVVSDLFVDQPAVEPDANGRYNILLLGTDAGADREGLRPDSVTVVSVDAKTGNTVMVGLPRELYGMQFTQTSPMYEYHPEGFGVTDGCYVGNCWLNGIYAEVEYFMPELYPDAVAKGSSPGIEATRDAVAGSTGLDIHFYILLNMDGFENLVNALGGVDINVRERLPIGGDELGNNVDGYIEPGQQHMDGYTALWYARSRYGSALGDYDRMQRQRELQAAILAQMEPANVLLRFEDILRSGQYLAQTDVPRTMLGTLSDLALKAKNYEPVRVELTPPQVIVEDPDYDTVRELVRAGIESANAAAAKTE